MPSEADEAGVADRQGRANAPDGPTDATHDGSQRPGGTDRSSTADTQNAPAGETGKPQPLSSDDIAAKLAELETTENGLSAEEAGRRLAKYGPNTITAREESLWKKLFGYFWGPIPWMIEAAALISLARRDWPDFALIGGLLLYNAIVGFWQDAKAAGALKALRNSLALRARVLRDNKWQSVEAADLVVGDVIEIGAGEILPADVLLVSGRYLSIDQAALTGESLPVGKRVGDVGYSGSIAKQGTMQAVVTATSNDTFFGKTAKLIAAAGSLSHSQRLVVQIGDVLILFAAFLAAILVGVEVYRDMVVPGTFDWEAAGSITQFVLVLLVASIPVALPAVMSVTLALGALTLSREKAIVSRLSAIDELAGVDILCSDKTGTLTQNRIALSEPVLFGDATADDLVFAAALATKPGSEDAIDHAVLSAVADPKRLETFAFQDFVPFDPVTKRTLATVRDGDGQVAQYSKGAPQAIAAMCALEATFSEAFFAKVSALAAKGYRALAVATSPDGGHSWQLLGLLSLIDPPREDAAKTIRETKALGLDVKMVTGDDVAIGSEISGRLGLGTNLLLASDVFPEDVDPDNIPVDAERAVERADGFGRVFPRHKYEIVKSLQGLGHVVAMTGDGVNDAPALKQADCGIAVSGATDAARSAAALVLTAPGLATIVNAIVEARKIFERINSYIYYRIAMTMAIMLVVVLTSVVFNIEPLSAIMIVALALLDDIPIMTIATDNVRAAPRPVRWDMHRIVTFSGLMGLMATIQSFGIVLIGMAWMNDPALMARFAMNESHLQSILFLQLAAGGHLLLFVVRSRGPFFAPPWPSAPLFLAVVATQIAAVLMCAYGLLVTALPWDIIGLVWIYVVAAAVLTDIVKLIYYRLKREPGAASPLTHHHAPLN